MELEEAYVTGDLVGRVVLPWATVNRVRHEWADQGAGFHDQLARVDAELNAVVP
ncbi:hypothetical protein D3C72_2483130 [compost metagenome]